MKPEKDYFEQTIGEAVTTIAWSVMITLMVAGFIFAIGFRLV